MAYLSSLALVVTLSLPIAAGSGYSAVQKVGCVICKLCPYCVPPSVLPFSEANRRNRPIKRTVRRARAWTNKRNQDDYSYNKYFWQYDPVTTKAYRAEFRLLRGDTYTLYQLAQTISALNSIHFRKFLPPFLYFFIFFY